MSSKKLFSLFVAVTIGVVMWSKVIPAKTKMIAAPLVKEGTVTCRSVASVKAFQERLSPILAERIGRRQTGKVSPVNTASLREEDIYVLVKIWNTLSPQFKRQYLTSVEIPDGLRYYPSPGGHFEIYYETEGRNGVDTTDSIGFSPTNWREKTVGSNGVPDYIDEVGFALDSSWSMEIDRFEFMPPLAYQNPTHPSGRSKVLIEEQNDSFYGITYLYTQDSIQKKGFSSYISLRNTWNDPEWHDLGYDVHPENGIRVTCAHELFHMVQYAMCWTVESDVYLDDFPYSWTEGAATSMEELAFDSINDYHQYSKGYFSKPSLSFFDKSSTSDLYTNSILFLYLYRHIKPGGSIDFVRSMLYANYETKQVSFDSNLIAAGACHGSSWPVLLHDFHRASFKTGTFADSTAFIADAAAFSMAKAPLLTEIDTIRQTITTNSTYHIRLNKQSDHADTIQFTAATSSVIKNRLFAISQNPRYSIRLTTATSDSFISVPVDSAGRGYASIISWKKWDDLTVIATNADPLDAVGVTLFIQPYPVTYTPPVIICDTISSTCCNSTAILHIEPHNDLHQEYTFNEITTNPATSPDDDAYYAIAGYYSVDFPHSWVGNATIILQLGLIASTDDTDTIYIGRWDSDAQEWIPSSFVCATTSDSVTVSDSIIVSGIYALTKKRGNDIAFEPNITVYPNPLSLRKNNGNLFIRGNAVTRILVYALNGTLLWKYFPQSGSTAVSPNKIVTLQWNILSDMETKLAPGIYQMIVEQNNTISKVSRTTRHKVLITP